MNMDGGAKINKNKNKNEVRKGEKSKEQSSSAPVGNSSIHFHSLWPLGTLTPLRHGRRRIVQVQAAGAVPTPSWAVEENTRLWDSVLPISLLSRPDIPGRIYINFTYRRAITVTSELRCIRHKSFLLVPAMLQDQALVVVHILHRKRDARRRIDRDGNDSSSSTRRRL